ncbi:hypothetical protein FHG87_022935 [Trinorchestia longiramus]|nr:hypothetical protein FHG87_022935 [Trinorchestia longiramus]
MFSPPPICKPKPRLSFFAGRRTGMMEEICRSPSYEKKTIAPTRHNLITVNAKEDLTTTDAFSQIIAYQKFDGSWQASDIASVLKISAEQLANNQAEADSLFVTSVVVVLFREHFNDRALEWDLMVTKAIDFLKMNSARDLDKLLQAAKHHLGTLRAQHPSIEQCLH